MDRGADREWVWEAVGVGRRLSLKEGVAVANEVTVLLNGWLELEEGDPRVTVGVTVGLGDVEMLFDRLLEMLLERCQGC